jgi:3-phosphoshikimate 1-carboxyvinyltransferase
MGNETEAGGQGLWIKVHGTGGAAGIKKQATPLDVGNSGTTFYFALAMAALGTEPLTFTGDEQIGKRTASPLLDALASLGVSVSSQGGCTPITVCGPLKSGSVSLRSVVSQYLSALLFAAPLTPSGTVIEIAVPILNERPYVEMTLSYLKAQDVRLEAAPDFSRFLVRGGAAYKPVNGTVSADFSSAAFPALAAAVSGGPVILRGLDPEDTQGDKQFFEILEKMGCVVDWRRLDGEWTVTVSRTRPLRGGEFDLSDMPDTLPALACLAAFAEGETALVNVASARMKETDRIAVMAACRGTLGVDITERHEGLVIHGGRGISGGEVDSCGDHRIVMALAAAAGPLTIHGAEASDVTYPGFLKLLTKAG